MSEDEGRDDGAPDGDEEREDPFEDLADDVGDREGDPFDTLAGEGPDKGPIDERPGEDSKAEGLGEDPTGEGPGSGDGPGTLDPSTGTTDPADPPTGDPTVGGPADTFSDVPGERADRGTEADSPDPTEQPGAPGSPGPGDRGIGAATGQGEREGDPFESAQSAFEEMDVGDLDPDQVWEELSDAEARGSVAEARERTYAEVSKHSFCEGCKWFSEPPDVSCGHEGTEILEFVDLETVRVVDCPVVEERRELQDGE